MDTNYVFKTPIASFRRLIEQDFSERFQIILGSQENDFFELSRNEARIISKKINDFCMIDPTINKYELLTPNNEQPQEIRNLLDLIILSTKEQVTIPKDKQKQFAMIRFLLGEEVPSDLYDIKNIKEAISLLNTEMNSIAVKYLSEHFLELLESDETKNLSKEVIISIIDKYNESEDEKQSQTEKKKEIFEAMKRKEEKEIVIHFIFGMHFDELIQDAIEYVMENLDDDVMANELHRVTLFIKKILKLSYNEKVTLNKSKITEVKFNGNELSGIISHLKKKHGDNLEESGALKLAGGRDPHPGYPITNLINYDQSNSYYNYSMREPSSESDSWIEFDFVNEKVNLTSYTIKTDNDEPNSIWKPKSWRIVGSDNHEKWTVLDHKENCNDLNGSCYQHRFECDKKDGFFRYIRYIQEDSWDSSRCKYAFSLKCFEMFGNLLEPV